MMQKRYTSDACSLLQKKERKKESRRVWIAEIKKERLEIKKAKTYFGRKKCDIQ